MDQLCAKKQNVTSISGDSGITSVLKSAMLVITPSLTSWII